MVLLIDADAQGSLTASLGFREPDKLKDTLAKVMENVINDISMDDSYGILHHEEGVELLPGNIELSGLEVSLKDGKYGREIINNAKTKIVLNMENNEAEQIRDILHLSDAEMMSIIKFNRGNGLISTNNNNLTVAFKVSQLEKDLITTDRKDLQELKERLKQSGMRVFGN